jgi:hypothetical protein
VIQAEDKDALTGALSRLDIRVPPRSEGRTKEHTERYAIAHLLSALSLADLLEFPLSVIHGDRPDFILTMCSKNVGIEHTEAVPENGAHRSVLREHGHGPAVYFMSRHDPSEKKKTAKTLVAEIHANNPGSGWVGDSVEREWAQAMLHFAKRKAGIIAGQGFRRISTQWLLVYDNWPAPALDRNDACARLHAQCVDSSAFESFDTIHVMSGRQFFQLNAQGVAVISVNDLWES